MMCGFRLTDLQETVMRGLMQDWPMLVHRLIDHAALYHRGAEIVSRNVEGGIHRTGYAEIRSRAASLARAMPPAPGRFSMMKFCLSSLLS